MLHYGCIMSQSHCGMNTLFADTRWNPRRVYLSYHFIYCRMIMVHLCLSPNGVVYKMFDGTWRLCAWMEQFLENLVAGKVFWS